MIRRATTSARHGLELSLRLGRHCGACVRRYLRDAWHRHEDLMATSPAYRRQVGVVVTATLGLIRMHPSFSVIATALGALYVSAHEHRTEGWRPGGHGLSRGYDDPDWDF